MPASAKLAAIGFMVFGCGVEMAGIMVSRGIVKWFKGREMALAMGSEMALARLGVATCMIFSPFFAKLRSEEHTSELQSRQYLVCRLLLEKKKNIMKYTTFLPNYIKPSPGLLFYDDSLYHYIPILSTELDDNVDHLPSIKRFYRQITRLHS